MKRVLLYIQKCLDDEKQCSIEDLSYFHRSVFVIERQNPKAIVEVFEGKTAHVTVVDVYGEYDRATSLEIATRYLDNDFMRYNFNEEVWEQRGNKNQ